MFTGLSNMKQYGKKLQCSGRVKCTWKSNRNSHRLLSHFINNSGKSVYLLCIFNSDKTVWQYKNVPHNYHDGHYVINIDILLSPCLWDCQQLHTATYDTVKLKTVNTINTNNTWEMTLEISSGHIEVSDDESCIPGWSLVSLIDTHFHGPIALAGPCPSLCLCSCLFLCPCPYLCHASAAAHDVLGTCPCLCGVHLHDSSSPRRWVGGQLAVSDTPGSLCPQM